ncbi:MAG: hypothetical protein WBR24_24450, partial [Desulfobacterales bacterium]
PVRFDLLLQILRRNFVCPGGLFNKRRVDTFDKFVDLENYDRSGSPAGVGGNDLFEDISYTDRGRGMGRGLYIS